MGSTAQDHVKSTISSEAVGKLSSTHFPLSLEFLVKLLPPRAFWATAGQSAVGDVLYQTRMCCRGCWKPSISGDPFPSVEGSLEVLPQESKNHEKSPLPPAHLLLIFWPVGGATESSVRKFIDRRPCPVPDPNLFCISVAWAMMKLLLKRESTKFMFASRASKSSPRETIDLQCKNTYKLQSKLANNHFRRNKVQIWG